MTKQGIRELPIVFSLVYHTGPWITTMNLKMYSYILYIFYKNILWHLNCFHFYWERIESRNLPVTARTNWLKHLSQSSMRSKVIWWLSLLFTYGTIVSWSIWVINKLLKINSTKAKLQNDLQSSYYEDNLKV